MARAVIKTLTVPRVLVGYDIHQAARRRRALKILRALTACYQKSFFDCQLTPLQTAALFERLTGQLVPEEDGLIFAWIHPGHGHALGQRWTDGGQSLFLVN